MLFNSQQRLHTMREPNASLAGAITTSPSIGSNPAVKKAASAQAPYGWVMSHRKALAQRPVYRKGPPKGAFFTVAVLK